MKIHFSYKEERLANKQYVCTVVGLGEEVSFTTRTSENGYFRKQAEAHILIKRLRVLFHQRQVAYQIMEVHDERMATLQELVAKINAITLVEFDRLYEYILENKDKLLLICPSKHGQFNRHMEQIILHAMLELDQR